MIYDFSSISDIQSKFGQFNKDILNKEQDFVILVHATWCGHCTRLLPLWKDCIKKSKLNIVNVESDALNHLKEKNQSHMFTKFLDENVQGYPTLLKVENNKIVPFEGERDPSSLKKFLTAKKKTAKNDASKILEKYAQKK